MDAWVLLIYSLSIFVCIKQFIFKNPLPKGQNNPEKEKRSEMRDKRGKSAEHNLSEIKRGVLNRT